MKKALLTLIFLMTICVSSFAQQHITNFGIVDTKKVYEQFLTKSYMAKNYESKRQLIQDELNKRTEELKDLKAKKDEAVKLDDQSKVDQLNATIKQKTEYLIDYKNTKTIELENMKKSLMESNDFYIKLSKTIKRVAENKGLSMVLNIQGDNSILWYSPTVDITEDVIKELSK